METLKLRFQTAHKTLIQLQKSTRLSKTIHDKAMHDIIRDSVIRRFRFSYDTFWKFLRLYLCDIRKINTENILSPRATFKAAQQDSVITPIELSILMKMIEDRNKTSHTYNEVIAQAVFGNVGPYVTTITTILTRLNEFV